MPEQPQDTERRLKNTEQLREIARNPDAFAALLQDYQRVLMDIRPLLEVLRDETRLYCRGVHVEGDRGYHPRQRSRQVEAPLNHALKLINRLLSDLEKSAHRRRAHDEKVEETARTRREKELERARKKRQKLAAVPQRETPRVEPAQEQQYSEPTSLSDLGRRTA